MHYGICTNCLLQVAIASAVLHHMRPTQLLGGIWMCSFDHRQNLEGTLPTYLSATLCTYEPARSLRSSTFWNLPVLILSQPVSAPFILLLRLFGIRFQTASVTYIRFLSSKSNLKLIFFVRLFWIHRCNLFVFIVCAPWVLFEDCVPYKNPPLLLLLKPE